MTLKHRPHFRVNIQPVSYVPQCPKYRLSLFQKKAVFEQSSTRLSTRQHHIFPHFSHLPHTRTTSFSLSLSLSPPHLPSPPPPRERSCHPNATVPCRLLIQRNIRTQLRRLCRNLICLILRLALRLPNHQPQPLQLHFQHLGGCRVACNAKYHKSLCNTQFHGTHCNDSPPKGFSTLDSQLSFSLSNSSWRHREQKGDTKFIVTFREDGFMKVLRTWNRFQ